MASRLTARIAKLAITKLTAELSGSAITLSEDEYNPFDGSGIQRFSDVGDAESYFLAMERMAASIAMAFIIHPDAQMLHMPVENGSVMKLKGLSLRTTELDDGMFRFDAVVRFDHPAN